MKYNIFKWIILGEEEMKEIAFEGEQKMGNLMQYKTKLTILTQSFSKLWNCQTKSFTFK